MARLILLASYGSRSPLRFTTVIPTVSPSSMCRASGGKSRRNHAVRVSRTTDRLSVLDHYIAGVRHFHSPTSSGRVVHRWGQLMHSFHTPRRGDATHWRTVDVAAPRDSVDGCEQLFEPSADAGRRPHHRGS